MNYLEFDFVVEPNQSEVVDMLIALLSEQGFEGFMEHPRGFYAYIQESKLRLKNIEYIISKLNVNCDINYAYKKIETQNWNALWESNFEPVFIANRVAVVAPFHKIEANYDYIIHIEPKMSFGTGHHETTSLMIETMLDMPMSGKTVLDMGCGTGILGILAIKLGANFVTAIDIDPWAIDNCIENCQKNHVTQINILQGDADIIPNQAFDIILANINRNVLLADIPKYSKRLNPDGKMLISGFYKNDLVDIVNTCQKHNLQLIHSKEKNEWLACLFQKV